MKRIILDTNFLLIPYIFNVDIFSEIARIVDFPYRLCVMHGTIAELEKIIDEQKGKHARAASLALQFIKQKSLYILTNSSEDSVDDAILAAGDGNTIVATQDKELQMKLKKKKINLIILRNKSHLELK